MSMRVTDTGLLCQDGFAVDGGHAEECGNPHPEDGAGAAGDQSCRTAGDISGTYLRRDGGCQSLE